MMHIVEKRPVMISSRVPMEPVFMRASRRDFEPILMVENKGSPCASLRANLAGLGFRIITGAIENALWIARESAVHTVVLANLSRGHSLELCRMLRRSFRLLPILIFSEDDSDETRAEVLDAGADDCLTNRVGILELRARIRSGIRRMRSIQIEEGRPITVGDIRLDPLQCAVYKRGILVHLGPKEFAMLHLLMAQRGKLVRYGRLLSSVWGPEYANEVEYLRTYMRSLRKKLEDDPAHPKHLMTVPRTGYRCQNLSDVCD